MICNLCSDELARSDVDLVGVICNWCSDELAGCDDWAKMAFGKVENGVEDWLCLWLGVGSVSGLGDLVARLPWSGD